MAEVVEAHLGGAELPGEVAEAAAGLIGPQGLGPVGCMGAHEPVAVQPGADGFSPLFLGGPVGGESVPGSPVEGDAAGRAGLGGLLGDGAADIDEGPSEREGGGGEVDVGQRRAHSSPRRAPVTVARRTNMPKSGSSLVAAATSRATTSGVGGVISRLGTGGGVARATGEAGRSPHFTAWYTGLW